MKINNSICTNAEKIKEPYDSHIYDDRNTATDIDNIDRLTAGDKSAFKCNIVGKLMEYLMIILLPCIEGHTIPAAAVADKTFLIKSDELHHCTVQWRNTTIYVS